MYRRNGICKEAQKIGGKEIGRILCGNQTLDVAVDILFVQKRNKSYGSREVTLGKGKGKGKEEGKRCFLSLLLSPISQTYSLLPGALLIFPSLPLLPMRSCYAFLRQEKPVLVPRASGWDQSNPVVPLHPSSCPERTIYCPVLLLLAKYCMSLCLRVGKVVQYGSCGKIRILCHIYYASNFELLQSVIIKS